MIRRAGIILLPAGLLLLVALVAGRTDLLLAGGCSAAMLTISLVPAMVAWRSTSVPRAAIAAGTALALRLGGLAAVVGCWTGAHRTAAILAIAGSLFVSLVLESLCWPDRTGGTAHA